MDMTATASAPHEQEWSLPVYAQLPLEPVRGEGVYLETADGRRLLDLYGGHAVASLGYGHPRLTEAVSTQARDLLFQSNAVPNRARAKACACPSTQACFTNLCHSKSWSAIIPRATGSVRLAVTLTMPSWSAPVPGFGATSSVTQFGSLT